MRKQARKILNAAIVTMSNGAAFLSDLSDTCTVCSAIDEIEELLEDEDLSHSEILDIAQESAVEILQEEGFPV